MRKERMISKLQPLQLGTIEMAPFSYIRGTIGTPVSVVKSASSTVSFDTLVSAERVATSKMPSGEYLFEVTVVGETGTGKYKVHDLINNTVSAEQTTSATAVVGLLPGIEITVESTEGTTVADTAKIIVDGDQTRIIPGTVVALVTDINDTRYGKWIPAYDDLETKLGIHRIVNGYQETNKQNLVLAGGNDVNISTDYTVSVVVFGEVIEEVCRGINLTETNKAKLQGIVWA